MKLEVVQKETDGKVIFTLDASPIVSNLLRREILESVPTMAIDTLEIRKNSSALYDEMLATRLGLLPLTTDLQSYEMPGEEESLKTHLKLTLQAKGPCTVYASDIVSKDPKVKPVYPKTPIAKLLKGQEIELEATAVLGKGKDHMKWAPGYAYYQNVFTFNQKKPLENAEEILKHCPAGVFKAEKGKLIPVSELQSHLWDVVLPLVPEGSIEIKEEENKVLFTLESWGQLTTKEILQIAAESISDEINAFEKAW